MARRHDRTASGFHFRDALNDNSLVPVSLVAQGSSVAVAEVTVALSRLINRSSMLETADAQVG